MAHYGVVFVSLVAVAAVGCAAIAVSVAAIAVSVGKRPRSRKYVIEAAVLGVLAGLAPISLIVFIRLSVKACVVVNTLGLPWTEPWREIAHWGAGLIWLASTVFIVTALLTPRLQWAGVAMLSWSILIAPPTFLFFFVTVYGDPAVGCVPV